LTTALPPQVQKLSSELSEYKAESKAIKNQDLTLRKQEETIRDLTAALQAGGWMFYHSVLCVPAV
jgi:hypothetical protein